jgi:hypothetical protein
MKKILSYLLIAIGASDLILWVVNGLAFGWFEFVVGVNGISRYGPWLFIVAGIWLLRRELAVEKSEVDAVADLEPGEQIVFKHVGNATIVTLTNKRIIYRAFNLDANMSKKYEHVIAEEKTFLNYEDISSVEPVKAKEIAKTKLGKLSMWIFGISIHMKDGSVLNMPTGKSELISAHITKYLNK